jgi:hypothetical protein
MGYDCGSTDILSTRNKPLGAKTVLADIYLSVPGTERRDKR